MAKRARDGKAQELAASRTLNPRPESVVDEAFASSEFFDARDLVQVKYEMVRRVEADGVSVSAAAGAFGFSRQSYYTAARALAEGGLAGLVPAKPGPRRRAQADRRGARASGGAAGGRPGAGQRRSWPQRSPSGSGSGCIAARWSERSPAGRPPSGARKVADRAAASAAGTRCRRAGRGL